LNDRASAEAAARLLAEHGTHDDAAHVAAYERRASRRGRRTYLARALVRRVTPTLRIHDLGRTTYEIAGVEAEVSASRKKPLALVLYLVTRSSQVGVREQVMEALWPDQSPAAAVNSLHQTLHFVRKELAPWRGDGPTAEYVRLDGDLVYIDPELVQVDSVAFMRQSSQALNATAISRVGPSVLQLYAGRFAPEFEYEDWAEDWRTLVHGQYLRLSQAAAMALLRDDMPQSAIDVLSRSIAIDPLAFDLRALLIRSLAEVGAADAAADHYRQHSNLLKRELGLRAPPYEALIRGET